MLSKDELTMARKLQLSAEQYLRGKLQPEARRLAAKMQTPEARKAFEQAAESASDKALVQAGMVVQQLAATDPRAEYDLSTVALAFDRLGLLEIVR